MPGTFNRIADNRGAFPALSGFNVPTLADSPRFAPFVGFTASNVGGGHSIHVGNGFALSTIDSDTGLPYRIRTEQHYGVSDLGQVAYLVDLGTGSEIRRGNGLTPAITVSHDTNRSAFSPVAINAMGVVAYKQDAVIHRTDYAGTPSPVGESMGPGAPVEDGGSLSGGFHTREPLLDIQNRVAAFGTDSLGGRGCLWERTHRRIIRRILAPDWVRRLGSLPLDGKINERGAVAFTTSGAGDDLLNGAFVFRGGRIGNRTSGVAADFSRATMVIGGVSRWGAVVYTCSSPGVARAAFFHDGLAPILIADTVTPLPATAGGMTLSDIIHVTINRQGNWALLATFPGGKGIFVGNPASPLVVALRTEGFMFGATIQDFEVVDPRLTNARYFNRYNQIAFKYRLSSGEEGVARLSLKVPLPTVPRPAPLPAPS